MSFSKEFRYRNLGGEKSQLHPTQPVNLVVVGVIAAALMICCGCLGVFVGLRLNGKPLNNPLASFNPGASAPKATATPSMKGEVQPKTKGLNENGLELTVTSFQRPLTVQGIKIAADQEFVLATVLVHNTKTTGQPIALSPADFKLRGDGGLTYDANPKTVTIQGLLAAQDQVAPGKDLERELIFQVAKDDTTLKMYWTVGKTTRVFVLEPGK